MQRLPPWLSGEKNIEHRQEKLKLHQRKVFEQKCPSAVNPAWLTGYFWGVRWQNTTATRIGFRNQRTEDKKCVTAVLIPNELNHKCWFKKKKKLLLNGGRFAKYNSIPFQRLSAWRFRYLHTFSSHWNHFGIVPAAVQVYWSGWGLSALLKGLGWRGRIMWFLR